MPNQETHIQPFTVNPVKPEALLLVSDATENHASYALPPDWRILSVDNETKQENPRRAKGNVLFRAVEGFTDYVNAHFLPNHVTTLWAKADNDTIHDFKVIAVLNDHEDCSTPPALAGWRDFTATYEPVLSEDFKTWLAKEKTPFTQIEFAEFIEDNLHVITNEQPISEEPLKLPSGADMYHLALKLEIKENAHYKAIARPQSGGIELTYTNGPDEQTEQTMQAFDVFAIRVPIYQHGEPVFIKARLRYRLKNGNVTFGFKLIQLPAIIQADIQAQLDAIDAVVGLPVYHGDPKV